MRGILVDSTTLTMAPWHQLNMAASANSGRQRFILAILGILIIVAASSYYASPHVSSAVYSLTRPSSDRPSSWQPPPPHHDLCIATHVHEEAHNLVEWIEYHHLLGFTKFFIHDDCSKDETMEVLQRYAEIGLVKPLTNKNCTPDRVPTENRLIDALFKEARDECTWLAVFNVDEFMTQQIDLHNGTVLEWMESRDPRNPYMRMVWQLMGNGGHIFPPDGLVTHSYTNGKYRPVHLKTLIKTTAVKIWAFPLYPDNYTDGYEHLATELTTVVETPNDTRIVHGAELPAAPFFLNHYMGKSLLEYLAVRGGRKVDAHGGHNPWQENPLQKWSDTEAPVTPRPGAALNAHGIALCHEWTKMHADKTAKAMAARPWPKIKHGRFYFGAEPMGIDEGWMDGRI